MRAASFPATRTGPIEHPVVAREIARAQRIIEGQNLEIRKTLWRYASAVEEQRRQVMERRQAILSGREVPDVWQRVTGLRAARWSRRPARTAVRDAERAVMLFQIDRAWRDHLALAADLREGIHLVALGGQDPLTHFTTEITLAFQAMEEQIDEAVLDALERRHARATAAIDLEARDLKGPSSTWTYLVNDDPFSNQIGMMLTGPGQGDRGDRRGGDGHAAADPVGHDRSRLRQTSATSRVSPKSQVPVPRPYVPGA